MEEKNAGIKMEANSRTRKTGRVGTKRRRPVQAKADKVLVELERYRERVAANEERLRTGRAVDGTLLTDLQRTNLEEIIARQRERLLELSS